jgi:protein involved in polysaccharide export with SLBB domain
MKIAAGRLGKIILLSLIFTGPFNCVKRVPIATKNDNVTVVNKDDFFKQLTLQNPSLQKKRSSLRTPVLYPGDEVAIAIYDKLPASQEKRIEMKRISDDGAVFILPVKEIFIGGLTLTEAAKTIESKLSDYIVSPFCEITITKKAFEPRVYVFGEVGKTGVVFLKEGDRLIDLIAGVGGCNANAYRRSIKIIRLNEQNVSMISINLFEIINEGKLENNILLQDQDIVFVPRRFLTNFQEVMSIVTQLVPWYYFIANFK